MSGTSMDGIDLALIETDGENKIKRGANMSVAYDAAFRERLGRALQDAAVMTSAEERPGNLAPVERELTRKHAEAVTRFLNIRHLLKTDISILGFHGQTVLHRPDDKLTVQLGLGEDLANRTGIETAYDFRAADVAAGGQGAPLVPVYHHALVKSAGLELPVVIVNLGGVGNVTYIGEGGDDGEKGSELLAFDTGPGNALIDDWLMQHTGQPMDRDGEIAAKGTLSEPVLSELFDNPYFSSLPPKSLDRNEFSLSPLKGMSLEDGAKTLTAFTAHSLARAVSHFPMPPKTWIISGGGTNNPTLMTELAKQLKGNVIRADAVTSAITSGGSEASDCCNLHSTTSGWSSEFMEAEAFAYLAVRAKLGLPITFPTTTGVKAPMTGGRIASVNL